MELLSYIEKNYETCTLTQMGKVFGMHGNYLTALLKEKNRKELCGTCAGAETEKGQNASGKYRYSYGRAYSTVRIQ